MTLHICPAPSWREAWLFLPPGRITAVVLQTGAGQWIAVYIQEEDR